MIDKLHYISQAAQGGSHLDAIENVLRANGKWIQLRIKYQQEPGEDPNNLEQHILESAIAANELCKRYGAKLIVNDYPWIALRSGADGVHLGLSDMPIPEARKIVGSKMIIGGTANTFEHILQRIDDGADYIGLGPYRFTTTKENLSPVVGLAGYMDIINQVKQAGISIPIVAIGGIKTDDITALMDIGLHGVAISAALTNHTDLFKKIEYIYNQLQEPLP
ncbi:thiamine phosphate synthase [Pedobacter metabolipauper]|uniref:Thiamine-phosphate synthase n=1 Tax=Pedobacter metabolipauper TaxID=425513 RepID=A0A4R6SZ84_9SPHI|nr:thiamine phosphate synthase [Pedobacter metabolipauper]TDQ11335.1 thiamine-phosphate diphosphorylase [Pedobacter metabolipauper]